MQTLRTAVKSRIALVGAIAVIAHLTPIVLLATSIPFLNRDEFLTQLAGPPTSINLTSVPDGHYNAINFGELSVFGDMALHAGAINFSGPSGFAMNFANGIFAWGADITPIGGPARINFSFGGENAIVDLAQRSFVGFISPIGFGAINAAFSPLTPPILTFTANDVATGFVVDNLITNTVPEPATLLLLATGAGLLGVSRRRKRAAASQSDHVTGG
jgi:hypothetical protein